MDAEFWKMLVAATLANLLTVWFIFSVYKLTKAEERQEDGKAVWYGGMLMPLFIVLAGMYLFKTAN